MPWLVILFVVVVVVVRSFYGAFAWRRRVQREFVAFLRAKEPEAETVIVNLAVMQVRLAGETAPGPMSCLRLYEALRAVRRPVPEQMRPLFERWYAGMKQGTTLVDASLERDGHRILPRLINESMLAGLPEDAPRTPIGNTGLSAVYVVDMPDSVAYVHGRLREILGLDAGELHACALANLRGKSDTVELLRNGLSEDRIAIIRAGDTFDAARLLIVPEILAPGGEAWAIVPDRDTLLLTKAPLPAEIEKFRELARTAVTTGPRLLDQPVRITSEVMELVQ